MNQFLASLIIIFFPGIIAALIFDKIIFHKEWDVFRFSIRAFVLGILSYGFLQLIFWLVGIIKYGIYSNQAFTILEIWGMITNERTTVPLSEVLFGSFASCFVSLIVAAVIHHKIINRLSRKCGVSNVYGLESVFIYFLNSKDVDWVYVRDHELDLVYRARLECFRDHDETQELLLRDVTVYTNKKSIECYSMEQIYINKKRGVLVIETPKEGETNG